MAPYPMRVRIKSSASLNVPPGSVEDVAGFLVFMFDCVTVSSGAGAATARSSVRRGHLCAALSEHDRSRLADSAARHMFVLLPRF
jgi:hypothetical protein